MKIGVYDDGTVDLRGGGFTFKSEVINGLIETGVNPKDKLFIFSWKKSNYIESAFQDNVDTMVFKEPNDLKYKCFIIGFLRRLKSLGIFLDLWSVVKRKNLNSIRNWIKQGGYSSKRIRSFENQLLSYGVDLVVYMEPWEIFTYKIPYVCICWDIEHLSNPFFPETNFHSWEHAEKTKSIALKRAVHVLTGTQVGKGQIHSQYRIPKNRISVVPFPTPIYLLSEKSDCFSSNQTKFDPESDFLFYPSSFWPHKNHFLLIEAMRLLVKDKNLNLNLVLCGADKGNKDFVCKLIDQYQLNDNIFVFSFLPRSELNFLYTKALAMIFPSHLGPDNLPPLEAFALGCPLIASAIEGSEEQLGESALLFDPFSVDDLVDKIILLMNNVSIRDDLIKKGLQRSKSFTSKDYAQSVISAIEKFRPYHSCFDLKTYKSKFA